MARQDKLCPGCGTVKPFSEYRERSDRPGQPRSRCRLCENVKSATRMNALYESKRPEILHRNRVWRESNPEKCKAIRGAYYQSHREQHLASFAKRCARAARVSQNTRSQLYEDSGGVCYLCGSTVSPTGWWVDHIIPVARGGQTVEGNLAVSCQPCNRRKHTKLVEELHG